MQLFDYIFNIGGDYTVKMSDMAEKTGEFSAKVNDVKDDCGLVGRGLVFTKHEKSLRVRKVILAKVYLIGMSDRMVCRGDDFSRL